MLTKTKTHVRIPRREWDKLRNNPAFSDMVEFLEDQSDFLEAKKINGKTITLKQYLKNRGLSNHLSS